MTATRTAPTPDPRDARLLDAARAGDRTAFDALVDPRRRELRAHCYRMLGSSQDAEDALQDALLKAWRGIERFDGRSSLRSWLYRVATNASLDATRRRDRHRVLPLDLGGPSPHPEDIASAPREETTPWLEPWAGTAPEDDVSPGGLVERRESVELAFVTALQHLPPNQRAALILRDVLDFSAEETATALGASVPSVNSALQRARESAQRRLPDRSQQVTLAELGDDHVRLTVDRYMDAMDRGDVDDVVELLSADATWSMPPHAVWFTGHDAIRTFLRHGPLTQVWKRRPGVIANGQPACAAWMRDPESGVFRAYALDVFTFDGPRICAVTAFLDPRVFAFFGLPDVLPD